MAPKITKEEAKKKLADAKDEAKAARGELRDFEKENDLEKGGDHSKHEKAGKKWSKLNDALKKKQDKVDAAQAVLDEVKKDKAPRPSKYEYPAEVKTPQDKKKYRAKMRAEKKRAEKGDAKAEKGKDKKSSKSKEEKKAKKVKAEPVEAED